MSRPMGLALAAVLILCAAPAFADRIDGKPLERIDGRPRISADGAPAILFEDRGGLGPTGTCPSDGGYDAARPCGARSAF
jgi:hypothetical protein